MMVIRRPATEDDRAFARDAHHRGHHDTVVHQFGGWDERRQDRFFDDGWRAAQHEILLCDGKRCGYVSVEQFPDYIHVRELVVHPDHQRRGIGSAFLRVALRISLTMFLAMIGSFYLPRERASRAESGGCRLRSLRSLRRQPPVT